MSFLDATENEEDTGNSQSSCLDVAGMILIIQ